MSLANGCSLCYTIGASRSAPPALLFGVTTDELPGDNEDVAIADIDRRLADYERLYRLGDFAAATAVINAARQAYPQDFGIMVAYMKEIALSGKEKCFYIMTS